LTIASNVVRLTPTSLLKLESEIFCTNTHCIYKLTNKIQFEITVLLA
jgi:hypothetical protein